MAYDSNGNYTRDGGPQPAPVAYGSTFSGGGLTYGATNNDPRRFDPGYVDPYQPIWQDGGFKPSTGNNYVQWSQGADGSWGNGMESGVRQGADGSWTSNATSPQGTQAGQDQIDPGSFAGIQGGQQPVAGRTMINGLPGVGANYVPGSNPGAGYLQGTQGPGGPANNTPDIKTTLQGFDWSGNEAGATQQTRDAMQKYGWTNDQIGAAMGFTGDQISQHFAKFPGQQPVAGRQMDGGRPGLPGVGANYVPGSNPGAGSLQGPGGQGGNPYLNQMANDIGRRTQQGLTQAFSGIQSNAVGVGGLGGDRQGVAQGTAIGQAMDTYQGNLANLYGTAWNSQQGRDLSRYQGDQNNALSRYQGDQNNAQARYQTDQSSALGWGGLDNQRYGMDQNFYTAQRGQDMQGLALGADLYGKGMNGEWDPLNNANKVYGNYTGYGNTSTNNQSGGGWQDIVSGVGAGAQFGKTMGWW